MSKSDSARIYDVVKVETTTHTHAVHQHFLLLFFRSVLAPKEWSNDRKWKKKSIYKFSRWICNCGDRESERPHEKTERQRKHGTSEDYYYNYILDHKIRQWWSQSILSMRFGVAHCLSARRTRCIKKLSVSSYRKTKIIVIKRTNVGCRAPNIVS